MVTKEEKKKLKRSRKKEKKAKKAEKKKKRSKNCDEEPTQNDDDDDDDTSNVQAQIPSNLSNIGASPLNISKSNSAINDSNSIVSSPSESPRKSSKKNKKKKKKRKHENETISTNPEDEIMTTTTTPSKISQILHESIGDEIQNDRKKRKVQESPTDVMSDDKNTNLIDPKNTEKKNKKVSKETTNDDGSQFIGGRVAAMSMKEFESTTGPSGETEDNSSDEMTLLLFYQYIEPILNESQFKTLLSYVETSGERYSITGRMRVAREGLNCTLTGSYWNIRSWCKALRESSELPYFHDTEFKLTDHLPMKQVFPKLHAFKVDEIVNYGLAGSRAPSVHKTGVHLEPEAYNKKMKESNTVIIDVRNHYEAAIGQFQPPSSGAQYIDPMMRKSTEFPVWLDKPETKEILRGKQVLMYCTGGIRCERASALLRTKIETEEDTKKLGIKGVYQLQGGIDKYFREFPDGGLWKGKNFTFDKRFSHAPPNVSVDDTMGKCEKCLKPWDMYRGKRRCPTCGVPSLICRDCYKADQDGTRKIGKNIRCDLCVKEGITSKKQLKEKEKNEMEEYESNLRSTYNFQVPLKESKKNSNTNDFRQVTFAPNPDNITRLFVKNLDVNKVDQKEVCELIPGITHIEWIQDRKTGKWYGSVFVEVTTPNDAAKAVGTVNGQKVFGRKLVVKFAKPDPKSIWPPPSTAIN